MASLGTTMLARACLQNMSLELIANILRSLCPIDILAIRQTCRAICSATHIKLVWVDALHRECARFGVFMPTFPIEKMTRLELEHAATSAIRFLGPADRTARGSGLRVDALCRYQNREIIFRNKGCWKELVEEEPVDHFILVPGGRFLLACSRHWGNNVFLWDLGYSAKAALPQFPIAEADLGALEAVSPTTDGKELLVATQKRMQGTTACNMTISQVKPDQQVPDFRVLGTLSISYSGPAGSYPGRYVRMLPKRGLVVFQFGSFLAIWNWTEGKGCKWRLQDEEDLQYLMYACDTSVITRDGKGTLFAWDIPTDLAKLQESSWSQLPEVTVIRWTISRRTRGDPKKVMMSPCSSIWQQDGSTPEYLALLLVSDDRIYDRRLRLFSVQQKAPNDSELSPTGSAVTVSHLGYNDCYTFEGTSTAMFKDSDNIVLCTGSGEGSAVLCTIALPTRDANSATELVVVSSSLTPSTAKPSRIKGGQLCFCPMSGRAVYRSEHSNHVFLSDYLLPPPERSEEESGEYERQPNAPRFAFQCSLNETVLLEP